MIDTEKNINNISLNESMHIIINKIKLILYKNNPSIYLFGSMTLNDFRLGWSDIDIIILTDNQIDNEQATELVTLRQTLTDKNKGNPYFRLFEGGMLTKRAFFNKDKDTVVYWGTSGQRVIDKFGIDSFAIAELLDCGILICGEDIRDKFTYPTHEQFKADIIHHYNTIRQYAQKTDNKITSCGWLLDIARGLYTLKKNKIIAKTSAGEWAINEGLVPNEDVLKRVIQIRERPFDFINDLETLEWCGTLGGYIQEFADVLEKELIN